MGTAQRGQQGLGEPWRRWLAAVTDVVILLMLHVIVAGLAIACTRPDSPLTNALPLLSGLLSWGYLLVSWGPAGGTPGMALWGLRLIDEAGGRPSWRQAWLRCAGYLLAIAPCRAGLLPILWDERRQGWHDRLAHTLVVRRDLPPGWTAPARVPRPPNEPPEVGAARGVWWAPAVCLPVVLLLTWPLAAHLTTHRPGAAEGGDACDFLWSLWYVRYAWTHGLCPWRTDLLFWPQGTTLLSHTVNWAYAVLGMPLQPRLGLACTFNVLLLATLLASTTTAAAAAMSVVRRRSAAVLCGLVFGCAPFMLWIFGGHANILSAFFLPVVALFGYDALTRGRWGSAAAAGAALGLSGYCDGNHVVLGGFTLLALGLSDHLGGVDWGRLRRQVARLAVVLAVAGLVLAPMLYGMHADHVDVRTLGRPMHDRIAYSATLDSFFAPCGRFPGHLVIGHCAVTPGWIALLLAGLGYRRQPRRMRPWLVLALCGLVLGCGPELQIGDRARWPLLPLSLASGPPGDAFGLPLTEHRLLEMSQSILTGNWPGDAQSGISLPLTFLPRYVPMLRPFRVPARFDLLVLLGVAVLAAAGAAEVTDALRRRWGRAGAAAGLAALSGLLPLSLWPGPLPIWPAAVHPFFHRLATDTTSSALVEVPLSVLYQDDMLAQTVHHKRLFVGNLARFPADAGRYLEENRVLWLLTDPLFAFERPEDADVRLGRLEPAEREACLRAAATREAWQALRELGTRYVVVHKSLLPAPARERVDRLLRGTLGLRRVLDDAELTVYDGGPAPPTPRRMAHGA